jgi:hypothetical protein
MKTEESGQLHTLAALSQGKSNGTYFTGGWVGSRTGLDTMAKRIYLE